MKLTWVAMGICALGLATAAFAEDGAVVSKRPLDLPSGKSGNDDEEEDFPESIVFYGAEIEGDVFIWVFPVYGFCGITTVNDYIQAEITNGVTQLSRRSEFGLVAYNSQTYVWRQDPVRASEGNKSAGLSWMETLVPQESHCLLDAALTSLDMSHQSEGRIKRLIMMGARTPYCGTEGGEGYASTCLETITAANFEHSPIDTFYFTSTFYSGEADFYQDLAAANQGTFTQIDY